MGFWPAIDLASFHNKSVSQPSLAYFTRVSPYLNRSLEYTYSNLVNQHILFALFYGKASTPLFIESYSLRTQSSFCRILTLPKRSFFSMLIEAHKSPYCDLIDHTTPLFLGAIRFFASTSTSAVHNQNGFERPVLNRHYFHSASSWSSHQAYKHRAINPSYTAFTE